MRVDSDFYYIVYALTFPTGNAFYIGKGTIARPSNHVSEARAGLTTPKCAVIRYIEAQSWAVGCRILFETDDENHAIWAEMKAISSMPYGTLCNLWGGGNKDVVGVVTRRDENLWEGQVFEQNVYKHRIELCSEMADTRIEAQRKIAPFYDKLVLPEYLKRVGKRARKVKTVLTTNAPQD